MRDRAQAKATRNSRDLDSVEDLDQVMSTARPADIASVIDDLPTATARTRLLSLPLEKRVNAFCYMRPETQVDLAGILTRGQLAEIVTEMEPDDRADLFNRLSHEQQNALLPGLAQREREDIRRLAAYAEGTAGAIMTSHYATLRSDVTAREALDSLRHEAPDSETIYRAYVLGNDRQLIGSVSLRELIFAKPETIVTDLMESDTLAVRLDDDQEVVARKVAHYDVLAVPVIDDNDRLVGIVTSDDALDILQQEATEDFQRIGMVGRMTDSVRHASVGLLYRKRALWLGVLVFGNLFSGAGIAYFEDTISAHIALVFFLPLLIGSSGNAGAQAATLMVRALATGDVVMKDWGHMLRRELLVSLGLGVSMALAVAAIGVFRGGPEIAVILAITMVVVVLVGSLVGISLPFLLSRFKLDPAAASAPLVTTIADATGVAIYFGIGSALLGRA